MQALLFRSWISTVKWSARLIPALLTLWAGPAAPPAEGPAPWSPATTAPLALSPCHLDSLAEEVLCGVHEVFEDRASGSGRVIPIQVAVLPPLRRSVAADPLFVLAGGPGQGARSFAGVAARHFKAIRRTRAIVLVDLRGTGGSHPLECPRADDELAALDGTADLFLGQAERCLAGLDADPRHYTHAAALADLDEVRRRLGYGAVNLWGGSWGTRAALLYALGYPGSVRSVVLDGAVSFDDGFPREAAAHAQRAMDLLAGRCASDPACAAEFPSPQAELASLLARFDRGPVAAAVRHPRTGAPVTLTLHRNAVAEIVRVALYTPVDAARLLQIIRLGSRGDVAPLAAAFVHLSSMSTDEMALGLTMSVLCSEDMPRVAREDFTSSARGTFLGSAYADGWRARCRAWPSGPGPDVDVNAVSHAPALILSGQHDPVTPPSSGDAMARRFADHLHVTVPGAAHNASFTGCVPDLIAAFLDGRRADLDTSCAAAVPLPAIVPGSAGGRP